MNAVATPKMQTFKWLLKREFWENRGGFFWAPLLTGGIAIFFAIVASVIATSMSRGNGRGLHVDPDSATEAARAAGAVGDGALLGGIGLALAVLAFVVFFYSLGSLYDDRRDRSVLFWKSLPISDTQMVLSKLAWALVLAPLLAVAAGVLIGLSFWLVAAAGAAANGLPGGSGLLTHSHPLRIIGSVLAALPVQILWSLPAVGWLMLCSAWARRFPMLWAVLVPFLLTAMFALVTAVFHVTANIDLPLGAFAYVVLYRGLAGVIPGIWLPALEASPATLAAEGPMQAVAKLAPSHTWQALAMPELWVGVLAGIGMVWLAIRMRRWRELAD